MFKLIYDDTESPKVAYLKLLNHVEHSIVRTIEVGNSDLIMADLDADGHVVGIEIVGWDGDVEIEKPS